MRIGYLMNTYPVTSATFIRREIAALEGLGVAVTRFAVRPWDQDLVDPADRAEAARCTYLLQAGVGRLALAALREAVTNPKRFAHALGGAYQLWRDAGRGAFLRHVAYLLEAAYLKQQARALSHIHAHFSTNTAAVALLSARLGGPTFSFTAHGPDEFVDPAASSLAMKLQEARFAVAITQFARAQLALAGGMAVWDKLHVVGCGVDLDSLTAAPASAVDAPFVCIGRLCTQKAQVLVVKALAEVVQTHPQARVILIGDGDTRPAIEALITQHGLADHIALQGWADNAAVQDALAGSRALLLPSFAEGLPIVIMEAFARARPVVSTFIAGIPELVTPDTGWLIPAGDVPALVQTMRTCLDTTPEVLAQMGEAGRARVAQAHDLQANASKLQALFAQEIQRVAP